MMTKKNVLQISLFYIAYVVGLLVISGMCKASWCKLSEDGPFGVALFSLAPLLVVFLLSLLTYWAKEEVFLAWFNVAKWFAPIIIATTLFFELKGGGGGGFGISSGLDEFVILWLLYIIFILVSLIKIIQAYMRIKSKKN